MKIRINVAMGLKKPGQVQYSSASHHIAVETELDISGPDELRFRTAELFHDVRRMLDDEIQRSGSSDARRDLRKHPGRGLGRGNGNRNGNGSESQPASNRQIQFLTSLLSKRGISQQKEITGYLKDSLGITAASVYELNKTDASHAIDSLTNGRGKTS